MGYSLIAKQLGMKGRDLMRAFKQGRDKIPYQGFLANIKPSEFQDKFLESIPEEMSGRKFIDKYEMTIDSVTNVSPDKMYKVRQCTLHPIYENDRVNKFMDLLKNFNNVADKESAVSSMGQLMYQSHQSYSDCGLGNAHTDEIVEMARNLGPENGIYGAKITGGGSGGTVCVLSYGEKGKKSAKDMFKKYADKNKFRGLTYFEG
jgi:L-arabinokinase